MVTLNWNRLTLKVWAWWGKMSDFKRTRKEKARWIREGWAVPADIDPGLRGCVEGSVDLEEGLEEIRKKSNVHSWCEDHPGECGDVDEETQDGELGGGP
jgi:hypothetical protein